MIKPLYIRLFIFSLLFVWCAGFLNFLFLDKPHSAITGAVLNLFYSNVCHQNPLKLISNEKGHMLICARCTGIYIGALLVSLSTLFIKRVRFGFFFPVLTFMLIDIILVDLEIYNYNKIISLLTGLLFGITLFPYILYTLENSLLHETQ